MIKTDDSMPASGDCAFYGIERHQHRFAAWCASRAASVMGCRFSVETGRSILETCHFSADFSKPEQLPACHQMDEKHREWRCRVIEAAKAHGLAFTHGVAAKLINCYLKVRFVCGGHHAHEKVYHLHPPIDAVLLKTLASLDIGGYGTLRRQAGKTRWSKFNSEQYERVIALIRQHLKQEPLWKIEEHWKGNQ